MQLIGNYQSAILPSSQSHSFPRYLETNEPLLRVSPARSYVAFQYLPFSTIDSTLQGCCFGITIGARGNRVIIRKWRALPVWWPTLRPVRGFAFSLVTLPFPLFANRNVAISYHRERGRNFYTDYQRKNVQITRNICRLSQILLRNLEKLL